MTGSPDPRDFAPSLVPVSLITANPHQPRRTFDAALLTQLAGSLKNSGLIQPIVVRKVGDSYELIAGERRLRAAKIAGLESILVIVREADAAAQAELALVENIQREDLNPLDRATAYRQLMTQLGLTQSELATRLGEERSGIANFLRLLDLAPGVQSLVQHGQLSLGHAKILAGLENLLEQQRLAELVVAEGMSVRSLERLVQGRVPVERSTGSAKTLTPHIADMEKTISSQLGMRIQLRSARGGKGRLMIHYGSLDQFDELLARLGVKVD